MVVFTFIAHLWCFRDFSSSTASVPIHFHCILLNISFPTTKESFLKVLNIMRVSTFSFLEGTELLTTAYHFQITSINNSVILILVIYNYIIYSNTLN